MSKIKSICVFCGGSKNISQEHLDEGYKFGQILAENNIELIYGGGKYGVMGSLADGVLSEGGKITSIFPKFLEDAEEKHSGIAEIIVTKTMHERKQLMHDKTDAFVVLAGGFGTMDETIETIVWKQIGLHNKPLVICNYNNYWDSFIKLAEHFVNEKAIATDLKNIYHIAEDARQILEKIHKQFE